MAKRKRQKKEKKSFAYANELIGLLLILLSVTGLGSFGVVGSLIKKFAIFMFGTWSVLLLVLIRPFMNRNNGSSSYYLTFTPFMLNPPGSMILNSVTVLGIGSK